CLFYWHPALLALPSFPTRRSSDLLLRVSCLADLVQPDDGAVLSRVAEGLELVVPGLPEREPQFAVQLERVGSGRLHRGADAILGHDDIAGLVGLGVEVAQDGGVRPAAAVGAVDGVLRITVDTVTT